MSVPLFFALYCLEAGLFFTVVPWTRLWTMNPWLHQNLTIGLWIDNPFVRGFVSGFGRSTDGARASPARTAR